MDSEAAESSADAGEAMDTSETTSVLAETTTTTTFTAAVIFAQSSITSPTTSSSPSSSSTSTEPSPSANNSSIIAIATTSSSSSYTTTTSTTSNSSNSSPPVSDRTRELLFLIYRFLETSNFDGVSAALHCELEAKRLLPQTSDALTGRPLPMSTVAEVRVGHRHIAGDHLLRLVEQAETAIASPPVAVGVSSLLMGGQFSLLRFLEPAHPLRLTVHRNSNNNSNGTTNSAPPSSENIDFTYSDTDVHLKELAELYSYNEELDFTANRTSFEELMENYGYPLKWTQALPGQRARVVERLAERLELTERSNWVQAIRALLYLAQDNFADCMTVEEQPRFARANIFTLYELGLFPLLV